MTELDPQAAAVAAAAAGGPRRTAEWPCAGRGVEVRPGHRDPVGSFLIPHVNQGRDGCDRPSRNRAGSAPGTALAVYGGTHRVPKQNPATPPVRAS
ncbi:hypothetical protein GCM10023094_31000 [Rhodococcus olei]|uniref:Uncharacterized protein n=1 Tax=Rhodococcus olei TaxID=2161675 RepID=A0ABP8P7H2_9NOCA